MARHGRKQARITSLSARTVLFVIVVIATMFGRATLGNASGVGLSTVVQASSASGAIVEGLQPGKSYRLIVSGTYSHDSTGSPADAECSEGERYPMVSTSPSDDLLDLYVDGSAVEWKALKAGDSSQGCAADPYNTYFLDHSPASSALSLKIMDASYADNAGSLTVKVACEVTYPGSQFLQMSARNSGASETATPSPGCPSGSVFDQDSLKSYQTTSQTQADSYQCGKYRFHEALEDEGTTFGNLQTGDLLLDSRSNDWDPVSIQDPNYHQRGYADPATGYYSGAPVESMKWRQTGHWGMYTCNWLEASADYTITVKGVYKYDQTVTGTAFNPSPSASQFGWADAECATGYQQSSHPVVDYNGNRTGEIAHDQYIPAHYANYLNGYYTPTTGQFRPSSTATPFRPYGSEWLPDRFHFRTSLYSIPLDAWDLGSGWGGETKQYQWTPLVHDSAGRLVVSSSPPSGFSSACSPEHIYAVTIKGQGRPIHFVLRDLVQYAEWDNCGALSIKVQKGTNAYTEPDPQPKTDCHYVPGIGRGNIIDLIGPSQDPKNTTDPAKASYFTPTRTVVNATEFQIATGKTVPTKIQWRNYSGLHSVTAAIDIQGNRCTNMVVMMDDPFQDNTSPADQGTMASDDCSPGSPTGQVRLFDCDFRDCMAAGGGYRRTVDLMLTAAIKQSSACDPSTGYCTIPYFCRYRPYGMRGEIVIRT